jgi:amino acid transporter
MIELVHILIATVKSLALWIVPLAVVAYVVTYFVMAIIFVICWKNGRDPTLRRRDQSRRVRAARP